MPNIYDQVKTAFRFYYKDDQQAVYSDVCEDVTHQEWLLFYKIIMPFQLRVQNGGFLNYLYYLIDVNNGIITDITATISGDITIDINVDLDGELWDVITYMPKNAAYVIDPGVYYLWIPIPLHPELTDYGWFSEYFEITCETLDYRMTNMGSYLSGSGNLLADTGVNIITEDKINT